MFQLRPYHIFHLRWRLQFQLIWIRSNLFCSGFWLCQPNIVGWIRLPTIVQLHSWYERIQLVLWKPSWQDTWCCCSLWIIWQISHSSHPWCWLEHCRFLFLIQLRWLIWMKRMRSIHILQQHWLTTRCFQQWSVGCHHRSVALSIWPRPIIHFQFLVQFHKALLQQWSWFQSISLRSSHVYSWFWLSQLQTLHLTW